MPDSIKRELLPVVACGPASVAILSQPASTLGQSGMVFVTVTVQSTSAVADVADDDAVAVAVAVAASDLEERRFIQRDHTASSLPLGSLKWKRRPPGKS